MAIRAVMRLPKRSFAQLATPGLRQMPVFHPGMVGGATQNLRGSPWFRVTDFPLVSESLYPPLGRPFPPAAVDFPTFDVSSILDSLVNDVASPALPKGDGARENAVVPVLAVKRTFQPSTIVKKRKMGFLIRNSTTHGRLTLKNRRLKGRKRMAV